LIDASPNLNEAKMIVWGEIRLKEKERRSRSRK